MEWLQVCCASFGSRPSSSSTPSRSCAPSSHSTRAWERDDGARFSSPKIKIKKNCDCPFVYRHEVFQTSVSVASGGGGGHRGQSPRCHLLTSLFSQCYEKCHFLPVISHSYSHYCKLCGFSHCIHKKVHIIGGRQNFRIAADTILASYGLGNKTYLEVTLE